MSSIQRLGHIALGLLMIVCSLVLLAYPDKGIMLVAGVLGLSLVIYGLRKIIFYYSMGRHMVGGYALLFVGVIAIDIGAFVFTLLDQPRVAIVLYLVATNGFAGLVNLLRSAEHKRLGTHWIPNLIHGIIALLFTIACLVWMDSTDVIVLIFCVGLLYSAARHIVGAFRRTDVAFIQ